MRIRLLLITVALLVAAQLLAAPVSASDGDQLCRNHNVFSNMYQSGGKVWTDVCQLNDCPTYVQNCHVQVRWLTKCEWVWCIDFTDRSGWVQIDQAASVGWCQNGKQQYKLEMRTTWSASSTKIMKYYRATESLIEIGGGLVYRLIAHAFFNYTNQTGSTYDTYQKTVTATNGYSDPAVVATTGSPWITLSC